LAKDAVEYAREKLSQATVSAEHTYEVGKERLAETYDASAETAHNVADKVKEKVSGATAVAQTQVHNLAETAQQTLEAAREKAREVFAGATTKVDEASNKLSNVDANTSSYVAPSGETTEIRVKAEEAPAGGIDRLKIEARATPQ
jgi:vacuolar-type H+-ATPase subunit H